MKDVPVGTDFCTVIIPVKNGATTICRCLEALQAQKTSGARLEIIVVDDGSSDGTADIAKSYGVRVLRQAAAGPAAARNLGVAAASARYVFFTDADCEPQEDWAEKMLEALADGAAGVKGAYLTRQTAPVARFVQLEYEDKYRYMSQFQDIDFIDTYSAGFRKEVFERVGGYDTAFPNASVEDQEFSFRVAKAGYRMKFAPAARVYHTHAATLGHYFRKKLKIGYWKVRVARLHPSKIVGDSHTPQLLKVQIVLAGTWLGAGIACGVPAWRAGMVPVSMGALGCFLLSTVRMAAGAWRIDRRVALLTPVYLMARSLALGIGLLTGVLATLRSVVAKALSAPKNMRET